MRKKGAVLLAAVILALAAVSCGKTENHAAGSSAAEQSSEEETLSEEIQDAAADSETEDLEAGGEEDSLTETPDSEETTEQSEAALAENSGDEVPISMDTVPEDVEYESVYTTSRVNVRTAPSTESEVYTVLGARQTAERIADDGEWSMIVMDGQIYYVASEYLKTKPERSEGTNGYLVVIDAGHQQKGNSGKEPIGPGASETKAKVTGGTSGAASGLKEYELNLQVAQKLEEILKARGYDVIMVRTAHDVDLSNSERAAVANDAGADAFIRIHANGSEDSSVNGAMTICQTPSNPYNGGIYEQSRSLSDCVLDAFVEKTGAKKQYVWETDTMSGINWAEVPTTIMEMGYMTNPTEDLNMASEDYQYLMAEGIADGIDRFLGIE